MPVPAPGDGAAANSADPHRAAGPYPPWAGLREKRHDCDFQSVGKEIPRLAGFGRPGQAPTPELAIQTSSRSTGEIVRQYGFIVPASIGSRERRKASGRR